MIAARVLFITLVFVSQKKMKMDPKEEEEEDDDDDEE